MATRLPTADSLNIQTGLRMGPLRDPFRLRAVLSPAVAAQIICSSRMQNALTELSCLCVPGNVSVSQHLRSKGRQRIEKIQKLSKFQLIGSLITDQKNLLAVGRCNMHAGNSHRRLGLFLKIHLGQTWNGGSISASYRLIMFHSPWVVWSFWYDLAGIWRTCYYVEAIQMKPSYQGMLIVCCVSISSVSRDRWHWPLL